MVLICISLRICDVEHFFYWLIGLLYVFFGDISAHFKNPICFFFVVVVFECNLILLPYELLDFSTCVYE